MKEFTYVIKDPVGLHARPAGLLVKKAGEFTSSITVESGGKSAEAKKLIKLMGLGIKQGAEVVCRIEGRTRTPRMMRSLNSLKKTYKSIK